MCRLLLSITASHLLLQKQINVLHSSMDIFSHSHFKFVHSSLMFLGFFSLALSFSNFQIFSIGFMSGLSAGHLITVTSSSERNVWTDFAVWHGALSSINTAGWLIAVLKLGTCFFNISLYIVALILLCSLTRGLILATEIMPNTITLPPPNLMLLLVHWGKYHSLGLCRTNCLPLQLNNLNFDSSLIWTQSHSYDMFSDKSQLAHFVLFRNVRLCRSYSTVQIYFIKSSGNCVLWYFNAKVSISSFRDSSCCHKLILFWFIINLSIFPCSSFPRPARWFLGFTRPSFLKFS